MSLLNKGTQTVTLYPEESYTDADGNTMLRASSVGTQASAVIQPRSEGTDDQRDGAYATSSVYRMRLTGAYQPTLGSAARVEWNGNVYSIVGDPIRFTGSRRTAHTDYIIKLT